jgi:peptidoglycan-associated lipoprotein
MGIMRLRGLLVLCLAGLLLGGCASKEPADSGPDMEPMEQAPELGAGSDDEASTEPAGPVIEDGKVIIPVDDGMGGEMTEMLNGVFYFDFDQAIVKRSGHGELDKHASVLSGDRYIRVRLEGHADERGTREYNLALGERRANAVRAYLVAQGASRSQIEVISYGEEKPDNTGHNESAWAQNRRVEIVYR